MTRLRYLGEGSADDRKWALTLSRVENLFHDHRLDTVEIAEALMLPEATIYRALGDVRERRRAVK